MTGGASARRTPAPEGVLREAAAAPAPPPLTSAVARAERKRKLAEMREKQRATKRALAIANPPLARAETATGVEDVGALLVQAAAAAAAGVRVATV